MATPSKNRLVTRRRPLRPATDQTTRRQYGMQPGRQSEIGSLPQLYQLSGGGELSYVYGSSVYGSTSSNSRGMWAFSHSIITIRIKAHVHTPHISIYQLIDLIRAVHVYHDNCGETSKGVSI